MHCPAVHVGHLAQAETRFNDRNGAQDQTLLFSGVEMVWLLQQEQKKQGLATNSSHRDMCY